MVEEDDMDSCGRKICPCCNLKVQLNGLPCEPNLHQTKTAKPVHRYEIVADGTRFGIAFKGKVRIHGMELQRAQTTVSILNAVQEMENEAVG